MKIIPKEKHNFTEKIFKTNKWGAEINAGGLGKFKKLKIGGGTIIWYSRVERIGGLSSNIPFQLIN